MNHHEGVSCDSCLKTNFRGLRYKCLRCFDFDLCAQCYQQGGHHPTTHPTEHPMQCILTRTDYELFYGGETVDQPQSFTCSYCGRLGFTIQSLQDHINVDHFDASYEVICPVCAAMIGGEPNVLTEDLSRHLFLEHRVRDTPSYAIQYSPITNTLSGSANVVRHVMRRSTHGPRNAPPNRVRRTNVNSSSHGINPLTSPSTESSDPIAELISQLSGVRRSAGSDITISTSQTPSNSTQLQQLHMQLQFERQHSAFFQSGRQQVERLPRRQGITSSNLAAATSTNANQSAGIVIAPPSKKSQAKRSNMKHIPSENQLVRTTQEYLLSGFNRPETLADNTDRKKKKEFVHEILFNTFTLNSADSVIASEN